MQVTGIGFHSIKTVVTEPHGFTLDIYFIVASKGMADNTTAQAVIGIWRVPSGIHHYMPLDVASNKSVYLSIHNTSAMLLFMAYAVTVTELCSTKRMAHLDNQIAGNTCNHAGYMTTG